MPSPRALLALLAFAATASAADAPNWNLPEALTSFVQRPTFAAYEIGDWLNPFYLRGDFDGDGKPDYAVLIVRRSDKKKGIAIWLSTRNNPTPLFVGAGTKAPSGGGTYDNWDFFNFWQVSLKHPGPAHAGESLLIGRAESASGLLYWDGKTFRWLQQGD